MSNIMPEQQFKRFGSYAIFSPETTREEIEKAVIDLAVKTLIDNGILKIMIDMEPTPIQNDDGTISFYVTGAWKINAPDALSLLKAQEPVQEIPDDDVFAFGLRASAMPMIRPIDKMSGEKIAFIMGTQLPEPPKEG